MDSWTAPAALNPAFYVYGQNILNKGGIPQTRPGSRTLACFGTKKPQALRLFKPDGGAPHLIAVVAGEVYISPAPFTSWRRLSNLVFNPYAKQVTITVCLKSTEPDATGVPEYLDRPYQVAIIQDELTRAAVWDGSEARHLNPTPSNAELTVAGLDETKIGLHGVYSNNRYWVARGRLVFASDAGDPLKFHESSYINEAPAFILPKDCTGAIETSDRSGALFFYEDGADFIETSIQDRTKWLEMPDIQRTVLEVGCIAPRSLIKHRGLIYWFSPRGWLSINEALRANIDSELITLDNPMAYSKARLFEDLTTIAAGRYENISLVSVPYCSLRNDHTWVLDETVNEGEPSRAWASVWTGWRPVEWTSGVVDGFERCFFISADTDGFTRVWEAFIPDRKDNGCDITCAVQFRHEQFNSPQTLKRFQFAQVQLAQLAGNVSLKVSVAGSRGWFEPLLTHEIVATYERVFYEQTYGDGTTFPKLPSSRKQSRTFKTPEWVEPTDCNKCGVEGQRPVNFDYGFDVSVAWSGRAAISMLRLLALDETEDMERGDCPEAETGPNVLNGNGCSATELFPTTEGNFPIYRGHAIVEGVNIAGEPISWEAEAFSYISQADAQRRAQCKAFQQLLINAEVYVAPPVLAFYSQDGTIRYGDTIDFGTVYYGSTVDLVIRLVNEGQQTLNIENIEVGGFFSILVPPPVTELAAGEFTFMTVRFAPIGDEVIP